MLFNLALVTLLILLSAAPLAAGEMEQHSDCAPASAGDKSPSRAVTLWLMFLEPLATPPYPYKDVSEFNEQFGEESLVTVLNTTDPFLRANLLAWDSEFAGPIWPMIQGQQRTLEALCRFAERHQVHLKVRFIPWRQAFDELRSVVSKPGGKVVAPDVVQVGSTWVEYLASEKMLLSPSEPEGEGLDWREDSGKKRAAIKFIVDLRLLFYRKPFTIDSTSWKDIIESLKAAPAPMVMPIGLTLNLLHDYVPLVTAGGGDFLAKGSNRVDLTSERAIHIPNWLAHNVMWKKDEQTALRQLLAFPEMAHEEATQHFMNCTYQAIIEPVGFIKRWRKHFSEHGSCSPSAESFWDYAGVALLPTTFKGGSDLIVLRGTKQRTLAFDLARFLATDDRYTDMLVKNGHLPAQGQGTADKDRKRHVRSLVESLEGHQLGEKAETFAVTFASLVERAVEDGKEYPALVTWPIKVESRDVLEALQRLWRRIGEGDISDLKAAAEVAQVQINRRINWSVDAWETFKERLLFIATGLFLLTVASLGVKYDRSRKQTQLLKVRGLASSALLTIDAIHNFIREPFIRPRIEPRELLKALIIDTVSQAWRRARDASNWKRQPLELVVWRAILLAIDSLAPGLFKEWEHWSKGQNDPSNIRSFLMQVQIGARRTGLLRTTPAVRAEVDPPDPPLHFEISCPSAVRVSVPFMLEQALVCLFQNAIESSRIGKQHNYYPIKVTYDATARVLSIFNQGPPLGTRLQTVLNESKDLDGFADGIDELLRSPGIDSRERPGIGLVEAYCIAIQCYGGLKARVDESGTTLSLFLRSDRKGR